MAFRDFLGRLRGETWVDGSRTLVLRNVAFAETIERPRSVGVDVPEPCDRCNRPFEERIVTTGTEYGDPEVWDAVPIAVDGWGCASCDAIRYPRRMSPETSVRCGRAGTEAAKAQNWRSAEWWFTRIAWAWPDYAPAYLDLASVLDQRLEAGFDVELAAQRRVQRRAQQAFDDAIDAVERAHDRTSAELRVAVYLGAAESAARGRSADRARRILDRLKDRETLDPAAADRADRIRVYVDEEGWIFGDASAVLRPYLQLQGATHAPIPEGRTRTECVRAVEQLEAFHAERPGHWQSIWTAAMGRAALGERDATLACWKSAWEAHPERPEIVREAALAFLRANRVLPALDINRDATTRIPDDATIWCNRAVTELLAGDLEAARACVVESQRLDPNDAIARNLGRRLAAMRPGGPLPRSLDELEGRALGDR